MSILAALAPIAASAIGAIGGFLGQKSANDSNRQIAEQNSAFNAAEAAKQREYEAYWLQQSWGQSEKWRGNAYQTAVKDMQAAGLNPMLAYSQGGADVPSPGVARGASATAVQPAPMLNKFAAASQAAQTIASVQATQAQADKTKAEAENIGVDTQRRRLELPPSREYVVDRLYTEYAKMRHELGIAKWDEYIVEKWLRNVGPERERIKAEIDSVKARTVISRLEQVEKKAQADYFRDVGKGGIYWREGRAAAGSLLGVTAAGRAASVMKRALGSGIRPGRHYIPFGR